MTEAEYRAVILSFVRAIADENNDSFEARGGAVIPEFLRDEARRLIRLRWEVRG